MSRRRQRSESSEISDASETERNVRPRVGSADGVIPKVHTWAQWKRQLAKDPLMQGHVWYDGHVTTERANQLRLRDGLPEIPSLLFKTYATMIKECLVRGCTMRVRGDALEERMVVPEGLYRDWGTVSEGDATTEWFIVTRIIDRRPCIGAPNAAVPPTSSGSTGSSATETASSTEAPSSRGSSVESTDEFAQLTPLQERTSVSSSPASSVDYGFNVDDDNAKNNQDEETKTESDDEDADAEKRQIQLKLKEIDRTQEQLDNQVKDCEAELAAAIDRAAQNQTKKASLLKDLE